MPHSFQSKSVLVTGATSGIGTAIAIAFARQGASLLVTGRNVSSGEKLRNELSLYGSPVIFVPADITSAEVPEQLIAEAEGTFGKLDVLVNNAGILFRGTALECSDEQWIRTFETNVTAAFRMSRAAVRTMAESGQGAIVNIASDWGLVGAQRAVAYGASKGAVVQLTRSMALDHAPDGIRVNAVCPGDTDTGMLDGAIPQTDLKTRLQLLGEAIPMGRVAQPEEVARAVCFLASEEASFITGTTLAVDGGNSAG